MDNNNFQVIENDIDSYLNKDKEIVKDSMSIGIAHGTFGELLQGVLPNNEHFLVTLPINKVSKSIIIPDYSTDRLEIFPPHKKKSLTFAKEVLRQINLKLGGKIIIKSELTEGKGLSSSSADLVATARALENALNKKFSNDLLFNILRKIEPTDGVMFHGCVSFYHRKVELREYLGCITPITIISIDEGGVVDTIQYNKKNNTFTEQDANEYLDLLDRISVAIKTHDLNTIGEITTRSAIMNQQHNPKHHLSQVLDICNKIGALGVIVTHSGTCIGIILQTDDINLESKIDKICFYLRRITPIIKVYESVGRLDTQDNFYPNLNTAVMGN